MTVSAVAGLATALPTGCRFTEVQARVFLLFLNRWGLGGWGGGGGGEAGVFLFLNQAGGRSLSAFCF